MKKDISSTAKHTLIYGVGNLLVKIAGLILIPLYTAELSTSEYGMLILLEVTSQFLVGVLSFHIPGAMLRFGSDVTSILERKKIYFTSFVALLGIVLLSQLMLQPTAGMFSRMLFDSSQFSTYFNILFLSIGLEILGILPLQLMRLLNKPSAFISYYLVKLVSTLSIIYYLIKVKNMGVEGAVWGMFIGNAILFVASIPMQIKNARLAIDREVGKQMIKFGAPLIFTSISSLLLTLGDRLIIKYFGELSEVGVYGFAYKIGSLVNLLVISSFSLGFLPIAYTKFKDPDFKDFFKKTFNYFMLITIIFTMGVSLFGKEVIKVISSTSPDYWQAAILVPLIAYAFVFKGIYFFFNSMFFITKRTKFSALVTIVGLLANLGLNFALIPYYDIYGAVVATFISYVIMACLAYRYSQKCLPIQFDLGKLALILVVSAGAIAIGYYLNPLDIGTRLGAKAVLLLIFLAILWLTIIEKSEKQWIFKTIKLLTSREGRSAILKEAMKG